MKLSPFVVEATEGQAEYRADSTLAGTRVRTELKDLASSLTVVTAQFLRDTGATNSQTLLVYTPNTEVAGVYGNYGGVGGTFVNGASEPDLVKPNTNNRIRGLDSADNTRDYFLTDIPWDSFNVDRVDLQRGPNSILFGIGSPAGIINSSVNMATYRDSFKLETRYGSFGSLRNLVDVNRVLLKNELTLRVTALDDRSKFRQKPAFNHDKRIYGAVHWDPDLFGTPTAHTTIRANFEHGEVTANRPHELPPTDLITPFFDTGSVNKTAVDPYYAWASGIIPQSTGVTVPVAGEGRDYWLQQGVPGLAQHFGPMFLYNGTNGAPTMVQSGGMPSGSGSATYFAIGPNGQIDNQINGLVFAPMFSIVGFNAYSILNNLYNPNDRATLGAASGFYKDRSMTDPSIFDFYNNLLAGPNARQWQGWDAFDLALEQTFLDNRLGFQVVYDHQNYHDGQYSPFANFITVDVLANTYQQPWPYSTSVKKYNGTGTAGTNPNAGRAYVGGNSNQSANSSKTSRENIRVTGTGELRATDFMKKSWLSDLLGRHVITGLYSKETYDRENRVWDPYAIDATWPDATGNGPSEGGSTALTTVNRALDFVSYLSAPLFNANSASGLHISPITASYSPSGPVNISYFDSHWKYSLNPADPNYVNPAAYWFDPASLGTGNNGTPPDQTQSENPANYKGWTSGSFNILNADNGDINSLYVSGNKVQTKTESKALTWQGYLWDDTLVATVGWRRDTQEQRAAYAPTSTATGTASMSYDLLPLDPAIGKTSGNSKSWGIVLHEPKAWRNKLPWGTNISLTYSVGNNTRVQNRYGFSGDPLPNATGETKDYGIVINTLNDRLTAKITWYKTTVRNANMSANPAASIFGANQYYLYLLEDWGLAGALTDLASYAGQAPAQEGYWDWANADHGGGPYDPTTAAYQNDPSTVRQKAAALSFLDQMQPQGWWDAYGFPVNVANAKAGNWNTAIANWTPANWIWGVSVGNNGSVHGSTPTGTIDDESKGIEFEVVGQVTKNWNVSVNASKQNASQIALGAALTQFVTAQYQKFQSPAGDIRLWWGSDMTLRQYYQANIYSTFQFLQQGNGRMVPEMSPWRLNAVTNYAFDHGMLKGVNLGLGYRWQQGVILGYGLLADYSNLDINKPIWGKSTYAVDLWAGYERKLSRKLNWRIQLNIRNFDSKAHLEPLSVEPDGSPALLRIVEGQTWFLTNTFSF
ncbi:MAG TPA: TonB-dependent receptor plug domain-containing protein [Opitutaceae bacterium]|nr:TonB-dependent receptor plug domain-containing protein [Opitutaceae bacterium]